MSARTEQLRPTRRFRRHEQGWIQALSTGFAACALVGASALVTMGGAGPVAADETPAAPKPTPGPTPAPTPEPPAPAKPDAPSAPQPAPTTGPMHEAIYKDLDGKAVDLKDAAGKPIIMEVWATWCGPCRKQRETMHELSAKHPEIVFVAASVDQAGAGAVRTYLAQQRSPKDSNVRELMATPELQARIARVNTSASIPKVIYINQRGQIIDVSVGIQNAVFMEAMIKNLTKRSATRPAATPPPPAATPPATTPGT